MKNDSVTFWYLPVSRDFKGLGLGMKSILRGFQLIRNQRNLWGYALFPTIINLTCTALILAAFTWLSKLYIEYIHPKFAESWWWLILEVFAAMAAFIFALGIIAILWILIQALLCSIFYSKLAKKIELQLGTPPSELKEASLWYQVTDAFRAISSILIVNGSLLFLHLIPAIGSIMYSIITLSFDSYVFGYDYFDYSLELRGWRRREKLSFTRKYRGYTMGLGLVVFLLNFIPVLGAIVLTAAVAGATLLTHEIIENEKLERISHARNTH